MTPLPRPLLQEIRNLQFLTTEELARRYHSLLGREVSRQRPQMLRRIIAYRLQENHYNLKLADDARRAYAEQAQAMAGADEPAPILAGARLVRVWKGRTYEAVSRGDGSFEYDGRIFTSLSAVAREITGTRWNGKLFFGVRK